MRKKYPPVILISPININPPIKTIFLIVTFISSIIEFTG